MITLLLKFLDFKVSFKLFKFKGSLPVPLLACFVLTLFITTLFAVTVKLKPEIGPNFFFSSNDPQMQEEKAIQALFLQDSQLVLSVKGDLHSEHYLSRIKILSDELANLPQTISVQSLSSGPGNIENAESGPLWSRVLIAEDGKSSLLLIFIEAIDPEVFIPEIEAIVKNHQEKDFEIVVSGEPYITELLRRRLFEDIKKFSLVAILVFGGICFFLFRSWSILLGMLLTCANASMVTLILSQAVGVQTGPLTANLSTIVFVLTLSHLIFIIFNWRVTSKQTKRKPDFHPTIEALKITFYASFWSMVTTAFGFLSLLLVKATPLKQLGAGGAIGTMVAFLAAYGLFPFFLSDKKEQSKKVEYAKQEKKIEPFFYRKHWIFFTVIALATFILSLGIRHLNTDPSLLAYFKKGGDLRQGLEYIDRNGGSSPLFIVVRQANDAPFNQKDGYEKIWDATIAFEEDEEVGSAISMPIIVAQAEKNIITKILTMEWLINILEMKMFGRVAKHFITEDRDKALIMLRMKEAGRNSSRADVIDRLVKIVDQHGMQVYLLGGVYSLQGRMSQLLTSSLISGLSLLIVLFVLMGWLLSRSIKITIAMFFSLLMMPAAVLGTLGYFKIPLDIISAPAVNIAIGMGVDAMIHMLIYIKREFPGNATDWNSWKKATLVFWRPIIYTTIIVGAGFGIFGLSGFPPTQRFGLMVVVGAVTASFATLIVFAFLASSKPLAIFFKK